ncbi:hypothetical protein PPYR_15302 [Photinus pyralis]|uniref:FERM and PDZ domain-containing protein 4 n=1 Tax=Photinus pyralis TaxID=7054 RepID=A0A5N4A0F5_PHOPY|nr:uncharacterized protein LOC116162910 isoform X1 [Photinus pyralis]XP_031358661.1 uncharacterized protein LOC116182280 isoform X1 [Photinus pyralis]KAB0790792.1 hypothetical protein PPYR_15302 [Photinus pyralis]
MEPIAIPEPRSVTLERSTIMGFGFVAGSEKPVVVRFVTEGGPSVDKLLPGDQILAVNGEDVKDAPREHVIALVRACATTVCLIVCQPMQKSGARKSTFLSASKRARLRSKPSRVRFAESVCVNGAPLFPPSAFSLGDVCVPPMANVLKVFLENGQTKSFKYDAWTTVHDVVTSLQTKLCLQATEHFSLVVEHIKSLKRNKLTLLDPTDTLARIASKPGAHKLRCLFRVAFVPSSAAALAQRDLAALDYLYTQCCNDVTQERFAPELQYDTALRLAALQIYQHALSNNISAAKLTVKTVERDFGLERFVPASLLENMKRKEIHKVLSHFFKLHASMAGPGKQLTALQVKIHYLDLISQLPSYGAKCFSAGPRADAMERVILVSPKFGLSQIIGTRNSVPLPIANLEDIRRVEVRNEDELSRAVLIKLHNERIITITLEERDASELVLVLSGYFKLATGQNLPVDQEESPPLEDLAPPYLSQHRVVPEKWSYISQSQVRSICFAVHPAYQGINHKTNGLYNTVGRQSKPPFMPGFSLDSNMNSSMTNNRNNQIRNHFRFCDSKSNSYDLERVASMEILETSQSDDVLRRVQEMHQLVENSEKYLNEQEEFNRHASTEWQETSVDIESDSESQFADDAPGKLKHSDSLLLLTQGRKYSDETKHSYTNTTIEILRSENNHSESDNDSVCTPHNSPKHRINKLGDNFSKSRVSFGLRSPDNAGSKEEDLKAYLERLKDSCNNSDLDSLTNLYYDFDPDIIDLTLIPPPVTPDELDCALPTPINNPPSKFADSVENLKIIDRNILSDNIDLEEFLASVTVPPPIQKVTPAVELTPEEIMSFIIPPPPALRRSFENLSLPNHIPTSVSKQEDVHKRTEYQHTNGSLMRRNSNGSVKSNIIEYATVERKGAFSCCAKGKVEKSNKEHWDSSNALCPPPRRSSDQKPPERPPKTLSQERQRSYSLTNNIAHHNLQAEPPPTLPPRGELNSHAPSHLYLPPKKPPLPPVPPLEVLRRKNSNPQPKNSTESRTACIGSPHLQRNRNVYNAIESGFGISDDRKLNSVSTAISTPTSPHLGRGAQLSMVPVECPDSPKTQKNRSFSQESPSSRQSNGHAHIRSYSESASSDRSWTKTADESIQRNGGVCVKNGCISTRENLLTKTDAAMGSLLIRLDQVAAQCNAAQVHGGGSLMSEEKFQIAKDELTSQSLQLVTSSKMLVIAMSDTTLPDLPENLAICLTILRRLTELCQDLANHTTAPLQTRNLIIKVHDVTAAFRHLLTSNIDRSSQATIEEHLASEAESLANVLATLLRSLRVFSP